MTATCIWCSAMIAPCDSDEDKCCFCKNYDSQAEALAAQKLAFWTAFNRKFTPPLCFCETCCDGD